METEEPLAMGGTLCSEPVTGAPSTNRPQCARQNGIELQLASTPMSLPFTNSFPALVVVMVVVAREIRVRLAGVPTAETAPLVGPGGPRAPVAPFDPLAPVR